jgi:CRP-like cAMP-binding protein
MTTVLEMIRSHPFLGELSHDALTRLSGSARQRRFQGGARIFTEGGHADRFWLIRSGRVKLDTYVPGKGAVVIESLGHGTVLGWSWMFPPYRWHFGATAVEPTLTIELDGEGVRRILQADPDLGLELTGRFMRVVVDRLQATRVRLLDLYQ